MECNALNSGLRVSMDQCRLWLQNVTMHYKLPQLLSGTASQESKLFYCK